MLYAINYIIALNNLQSHKVDDIKAEAKSLGIGPPTLFLDLNPTEYVIRNRVISTTFVMPVNDMRTS